MPSTLFKGVILQGFSTAIFLVKYVFPLCFIVWHYLICGALALASLQRIGTYRWSWFGTRAIAHACKLFTDHQ